MLKNLVSVLQKPVISQLIINAAFACPNAKDKIKLSFFLQIFSDFSHFTTFEEKHSRNSKNEKITWKTIFENPLPDASFEKIALKGTFDGKMAKKWSDTRQAISVVT